MTITNINKQNVRENDDPCRDFQALGRGRDPSVALKVGRAMVYRVKNKKALRKDPVQENPKLRRNPIITPRVLGGLECRIRAAPTKSLRMVAQEAGINRESILKVVVGASWKSRRRKKVPLISKAGRKKRVDRSRGLLNSLKSSGFPGRILFFSDEKNFVVDPAYNPQNNLVRVAPDCNRSYCEDSFSGYSGSV